MPFSLAWEPLEEECCLCWPGPCKFNILSLPFPVQLRLGVCITQCLFFRGQKHCSSCLKFGERAHPLGWCFPPVAAHWKHRGTLRTTDAWVPELLRWSRVCPGHSPGWGPLLYRMASFKKVNFTWKWFQTYKKVARIKTVHVRLKYPLPRYTY